MIDYEKLATMIFRVIGVFFMVIALVLFLMLVFLITLVAVNGGSLGLDLQLMLLSSLYSIPSIIIGLILFRFSGYLGFKVTADLNG